MEGTLTCNNLSRPSPDFEIKMKRLRTSDVVDVGQISNLEHTIWKPNNNDIYNIQPIPQMTSKPTYTTLPRKRPKSTPTYTKPIKKGPNVLE